MFLNLDVSRILAVISVASSICIEIDNLCFMTSLKSATDYRLLSWEFDLLNC